MKRNHNSFLVWQWKTARIIFAFLFSYLTACSHTSTEHIQAHQLEHLLSGKALLGQDAAHIQLPKDDIFTITPGMKTFVDRHVPKKATNMQKVDKLQRALMLGMKYDPHKTYTPKETFEQGQSNCLGFTLLFYSLAKYAGLDVYINEVDIPPTWNMTDNSTLVFMRHVNAKVKLGRGFSTIVDLDIQSYNPNYKQRNVNMQTARAQFYNNKGMEFMIAENYKDAFRYLRKSIEVHPKLDHVWNNLGVLYSRNQHYKEAELAYLKAFSMDAKNLTTLNNISSLYYRTGDKEKADYYDQKARHHRERNPYHHYAIAKKAYSELRYVDALISLETALKYEKKDQRFYQLGAEIYQRLGLAEKAEKLLSTGEKYTQ